MEIRDELKQDLEKLIFQFKDNNLKTPFTLILSKINESSFRDSNESDGVVFNSPRQIEKADLEKVIEPYLDKETIKFISSFKSNLNVLKNNGKLDFALPILKEILDKYKSEILFVSDEPIKLSKEGEIILPDFQYTEIPLSHLTKAVYLLFVNNPKGIDIKNLSEYETELLKHYLEISHHINFDVTMESIKNLVDPNSKAIYSHISRIKTAFVETIGDVLAENFIINSDGFGSSIKYIPILKILSTKQF